MTDATPPGPETVGRNLEAAARLREIYEREGPWGVLERYEDCFYEDAVWEPAVSAFGSVSYSGREGMRRWINDMEAVANDFTQVITEVRAIGNRHVLALGTMRIVGKESGLAFEGDYAQVWEVERGRMKSMRAYLTHAEAEAAARRAEREVGDA
jgi:ketosteroid isomerase-like protein